VRNEATEQPDEPQGRAALERHDRKADDVRGVVADDLFDRLRNAVLHQDQVRDRDPVVPIDIAGERGERPVRHAHRQRRRVLERIRHREQQDAHGRLVGTGYT
jgi:hypothetical protein